jgi:hypothetical protein
MTLEMKEKLADKLCAFRTGRVMTDIIFGIREKLGIQNRVSDDTYRK